eukprot:4960647-Pleurochrysis_carterae.AAC.12
MLQVPRLNLRLQSKLAQCDHCIKRIQRQRLCSAANTAGKDLRLKRVHRSKGREREATMRQQESVASLRCSGLVPSALPCAETASSCLPGDGARRAACHVVGAR